MRDRPQIVAGLLVFVGLFTSPLWYHPTPGGRQGPQVKLPAQAKQCVAPVDYMRRSHMQLLVTWREEVVRDGERQFPAYNGKTYDKSLTRTCLAQCHTNKAEFCDRCHTYAGVSGPYCWQCHSEPRPVLARSTP